MEDRTHIRLSAFECSVVAALLILLVAAGVPSVLQIRREPRESELRLLRTSFAEALGELHGRWLLAGGDADQIEVHGLRIALNRSGWPTLDPRHPTQDTAIELFQLVMRRQLPRGWISHEIQAPDSGFATFMLPGTGGGSFLYQATTGMVE